MAYTFASCDLDAAPCGSMLATDLGLQNLGVSVYVFGRGQGYDYFHSHREQEEVYLCLDGVADLILAGDDPNNLQTERLTLHRGDVVRVDPATLRAVGNSSSDRAVVLIAGACPHPYPAGFGDHDVIADVRAKCGEGQTGFERPLGMTQTSPPAPAPDC
ncbi:MAG: cupin domain-containing protein [Myxococcota bacterium]